MGKLDIERTARLLIRQHGENAATWAAIRADELLEDGDPLGSKVLVYVWKEIERLQALPVVAAIQ